MKSGWTLPSVLLLVGLLCAWNPVLADDSTTDGPPEKISKYMRAKLVYSQKLLEALTLEDFDQMTEYSQKLKLLSQESTWNVLQTEQYLQNSTEFRRGTDALSDAARRRTWILPRWPSSN